MHRFLAGIFAGALVLSCVSRAGAQTPPSIRVDGQVALASLESLCDDHLRSVLGGLDALAATPGARGANWTQIESPLRALAEGLDLTAAVWFADRGGAIWTVGRGRQSVRIADRPYFSRLLQGRQVVGDLVVSRTTGKAVAIVAVPILDASGKTIGALGASVDLARLSAELKREMNVGAGNIFFSIDSSGVVGITMTPGYIMRGSRSISPEFHAAFAQMLQHDAGTVTYSLGGVKRIVIYRKSPFTGWRYAFGIVTP
ncbi:MAG TPA: cache domain-containing protein [Candidatus Baltobacteraceae bacterium]|nr:cache domain-containing protein [Candidatus Baltobacteraceae bacterium]